MTTYLVFFAFVPRPT